MLLKNFTPVNYKFIDLKTNEINGIGYFYTINFKAGLFFKEKI